MLDSLRKYLCKNLMVINFLVLVVLVVIVAFAVPVVKAVREAIKDTGASVPAGRHYQCKLNW